MREVEGEMVDALLDNSTVPALQNAHFRGIEHTRQIVTQPESVGAVEFAARNVRVDSDNDKAMLQLRMRTDLARSLKT